jgi:hypothetical protein
MKSINTYQAELSKITMHLGDRNGLELGTYLRYKRASFIMIQKKVKPFFPSSILSDNFFLLLLAYQKCSPEFYRYVGEVLIKNDSGVIAMGDITLKDSSYFCFIAQGSQSEHSHSHCSTHVCVKISKLNNP